MPLSNEREKHHVLFVILEDGRTLNALTAELTPLTLVISELAN